MQVMEEKPSDPQSARQDALSIDDYNDSHTFVIRIWLEDVDNHDTPAFWRGNITHVLDHRQRYFQELSGIVNFIKLYLERWEANRKP